MSIDELTVYAGTLKVLTSVQQLLQLQLFPDNYDAISCTMEDVIKRSNPVCLNRTTRNVLMNTS